MKTVIKNIPLPNENLSLLEYFKINCSYVDEIEQKEIEDLNINFDDVRGKEINVSLQN